MRRTSCLAVLALSTALGASFALATLDGCEPSPAITVIHLGPGETKDNLRGDVIKTRRGGQESFVGIRGGFYVVRSAEDWRVAWPSGNAPPMPSTLETARQMLLVAVAEKKDTVGIQIHKVLETGDKIYVWVKETAAGQGCKPTQDQKERAAFDAVVADRNDKPVQFLVEADRAESCGDVPSVLVSCRLNDGPNWLQRVTAQPGDKLECEMHAEAHGKFPLVDDVLSLGDLPGGSAAKLAYTKGSTRGTFVTDVFGTYGVRGEASDEGGRHAQGTAIVEALPPKTRDVLVQLVWTNFDASDDPDTFPRVKLGAAIETKDHRTERPCSIDEVHPELCEVKTHSAYTHMKLKASDKHMALDVKYVDERFDKGPLVCVQLYFDGARTGEKCDRAHRNPDERWSFGTVDMATGTLIEPPSAGDAGAGDSGAGDGGADSGADAAAKKPGPAPAPAPKK